MNKEEKLSTKIAHFAGEFIGWCFVVFIASALFLGTFWVLINIVKLIRG